MRLLFYSDVVAFGGHEVTVLDAVAGAASMPDIQVGVAFCSTNQTLHDRLLAQFGHASGVDLMPHGFSHEAGDLLRAFAPCSKRRAISVFIRRWRPDWVLVCQGHIGVSICALSASVRSGAQVASYVPMAHSLRQMSGRNSLAIACVDSLLARAYAWPNAFLTISVAVAEQLRGMHKVDGDRIRVIEYGPDLSRLTSIDKQAARARLGLDDGYWMGLVGRVEFGQKGHDVALEALARHGDRMGGARLLVAGDGPDVGRAQELVANLGLASRVRFIPWTDSPSTVYSALDLLLLPSRYEGVPIVMMEAMYLGLPIVASDTDGMQELLPAAWRFTCGSPAALADAVSRVRAGVDPGVLRRHREYIAHERNCVEFRKRVGRWVQELAGNRGVRN